MSRSRKLPFCLAVISIISASLVIGVLPASAQTPSKTDPWPGLAAELFQDRALNDGKGVLTLGAPDRAEDAALVPIDLKIDLAPDDSRQVKKITLVIDQNPAPVAAVFELGEKAGVDKISTRVRVNQYTNIHAVAELSGGGLYVVSRYVKAAGGCSAPAVKNLDEANAQIGEMRFKEFPQQASASSVQAQVMIRHPNSSGMQMDQLTHLYIPARYIDHLEVRQGTRLVFSVEGGISISEDPNFRFDYRPNGGSEIYVEAKDTDGKVFQKAWPLPTLTQ